MIVVSCPLFDVFVTCVWLMLYSSRFIEKYGTHIIVGVKIGGKDVVYVKQQHSSNLQPTEVQKRLKEMADRRFQDADGQVRIDSEEAFGKDKVSPSISFKVHEAKIMSLVVLDLSLKEPYTLPHKIPIKLLVQCSR